jgi:F-type H+-transporting ATPase subunit b
MKMRGISQGAWAALCLLIQAAALAASGEGGGAEKSNDVFSGDVFTSLFGLALFVLLMLVLGKWAWKPILSALKRREEHIHKAIADAEKACQDAERSLAEYQQRLNQAKAESDAILEQGRKDSHRLAEEMKKHAQEEAGSLRQKAVHDIAVAKDQALQDLYYQTVRLSTELAGKIIKKSLNSEEHRQLIQETIGQMPRLSDEKQN